MPQTVTEYLTKQIFVENAIVTYRSLSRTFGISVNRAKNELAAFYRASNLDGREVYATFAICGRPREPKPDATSAEPRASKDASPSVFIVLIVDEFEFEEAMDTFVEGTQAHVYSLSPALVTDPGLLVIPVDSPPDRAPTVIPAEDKLPLTAGSAKGDKEHQISKPSQAGPSQPVQKANTLDMSKFARKASSSKPLARSTSEGGAALAPATSTLIKESGIDPSPPKKTVSSTPVPSKLNFKQAPKKETVVAKQESPQPAKPTTPAFSTQTTVPAPLPRNSSIRVRKGVLLSDDEDDTVKPRRTSGFKRKSTASEGDDEGQVDTEGTVDTMDVDEAPPDTSPEPVDLMDRDESPEAEAPQKDESAGFVDKKERKSRKKGNKSVPVGKNGRPKKKVMKTREEVGKNGYTDYVDYSSWESASDSEEVVPKVKEEDVPMKSVPAVSKKADTSTKSAKGARNLNSFFKKK